MVEAVTDQRTNMIRYLRREQPKFAKLPPSMVHFN
jgi:hypothetical protein